MTKFVAVLRVDDELSVGISDDIEKLKNWSADQLNYDMEHFTDLKVFSIEEIRKIEEEGIPGKDGCFHYIALDVYQEQEGIQMRLEGFYT